MTIRSVVVDTSDPAAFWASLTPAEQFALLDAPPKVLGPWVLSTDYRHRELWTRSGPEDTGCQECAHGGAIGFVTLWKDTGAIEWVVVRPERTPPRTTSTDACATVEAAKLIVDERLRADGWGLA